MFTVADHSLEWKVDARSPAQLSKTALESHGYPHWGLLGFAMRDDL